MKNTGVVSPVQIQFLTNYPAGSCNVSIRSKSQILNSPRRGLMKGMGTSDVRASSNPNAGQNTRMCSMFAFLAHAGGAAPTVVAALRMHTNWVPPISLASSSNTPQIRDAGGDFLVNVSESLARHAPRIEALHAAVIANTGRKRGYATNCRPKKYVKEEPVTWRCLRHAPRPFVPECGITPKVSARPNTIQHLGWSSAPNLLLMGIVLRNVAVSGKMRWMK